MGGGPPYAGVVRLGCNTSLGRYFQLPKNIILGFERTRAFYLHSLLNHVINRTIVQAPVNDGSRASRENAFGNDGSGLRLLTERDFFSVVCVMDKRALIMEFICV